jgi:hypothetical protein
MTYLEERNRAWRKGERLIKSSVAVPWTS